MFVLVLSLKWVPGRIVTKWVYIYAKYVAAALCTSHIGRPTLFYEVCDEFCRYWLRCVDNNPRTEYEEHLSLNWFFKCIFYFNLWKLLFFWAIIFQLMHYKVQQFSSLISNSISVIRLRKHQSQLSFLLVFRIPLIIFPVSPIYYYHFWLRNLTFRFLFRFHFPGKKHDLWNWTIPVHRQHESNNENKTPRDKMLAWRSENMRSKNRWHHPSVNIWKNTKRK